MCAIFAVLLQCVAKRCAKQLDKDGFAGMRLC